MTAWLAIGLRGAQDGRARRFRVVLALAAVAAVLCALAPSDATAQTLPKISLQVEDA